MESDPSAGFPPQPPVFERIEQIPATLSLTDRLDLIRLAHATSNFDIKRHALLLLDQAAAPAFMVMPHVVSSTQNDDLPPREYTAEEMEKLKPGSISGNNR